MSNRKGSTPSVSPQSSDLARNIHPSADAEHLAKLCQRVDMPLALKLLKFGINYDRTTWKRLRLGARLHMLSQTPAARPHHSNSKRPIPEAWTDVSGITRARWPLLHRRFRTTLPCLGDGDH